MIEYPGSLIIHHKGDKLPEIGDIYWGATIMCPHEIGEYVHISTGVRMVGQGKVYIGEGCTFSPNVVVYTSSPSLDDKVLGNKYLFDFKIKTADVRIGNHVFVGANSTLHQGISIADRVVIGANSFVNRDINKSGIYVGAPAKLIKSF